MIDPPEMTRAQAVRVQLIFAKSDVSAEAFRMQLSLAASDVPAEAFRMQLSLAASDVPAGAACTRGHEGAPHA